MAKSNKLSISLTHREQAVGWFYLVFETLFLPGILLLCNQLLPNPYSNAFLNFIYFSLNFIAVILIFHKFFSKSFKILTRNFWIFLQAVILGFVAYWVCSELLKYITRFLCPAFQNANNSNIITMAGTNYGLMLIGTVILVPVAEECMFRGLIFLGIYHKNQFAAYAVSVICFSLIHMIAFWDSYSPVGLILCFLQYVPAGIWLAWSFEKSGTIFAPMLIHSIVNATAIFRLR